MTMTPERWQRVKQLLETLLEAPPEQRAGLLRSSTTEDSGVRGEVESLLAHATDDFLDRSPVSAPVAPAEGYAPAPASAAAVDTVRVEEMPPYTRVEVQTRRTRYAVVIVAPLGAELLLQGGDRFPEPVRATLDGRGVITVGDRMSLRVDDRRVTTSRVRQIRVNPGES